MPPPPPPPPSRPQWAPPPPIKSQQLLEQRPNERPIHFDTPPPPQAMTTSRRPLPPTFQPPTAIQRNATLQAMGNSNKKIHGERPAGFKPRPPPVHINASQLSSPAYSLPRPSPDAVPAFQNNNSYYKVPSPGTRIPPPPVRVAPVQAGYAIPPPPTNRNVAPFPPTFNAQYHQGPRRYTTASFPSTSHQSNDYPITANSVNEVDPSRLPKVSTPTLPLKSHQDAIFYPKSACTSQSDPVQPPPPPDSRFVVVDDGNASPHLIRSEMYAIPKEKSILREVLGEDSSIGFISTPMAIPSANVPVYQTSQLPEELRLSHIAIDGTSVKSKPPRCAYCHAYANPFWNHAKCNFCTRINRSACPPLASQLGTVEYPVDGPYVTRSPVKPNIIYAIDATAPSCEQYVRLLAKDVIPKIAQHAQLQQQNRRDPPRVRVGIVLAASSGIYIPSLSGIEPRFVVMPDIKQEPYSPLPLSEWTFDICEDVGKMKMFLSALLNSLVPQLIKERVRVHNTIGPGNGNHHPPYQLSCGGAAMAFMVDALKNTGGRAVWISWRRPNCGVGSLKDRERANSEKKEHITGKAPFLSDPNNKFYKKLTERCQKSRIALDVVLHTNPTVPKSFLDVATLGQLCQATNGNLLRICAPAAVWESCLASSLTKIVSCVSGWDCILKIRCSTGLRIHSFQGNGVGKIVNSKNLTNDSPDLELPVVQQDTCIGFNLEHRVGGVPKQDSFVFVQTALLYTNIWTGERRVRVSTLGLRTANNPAACFPSLDFGTIVASELRAVSAGLQNGETNFSTKKKILDQCVKILALYRKATKNDPLLSQSQLVLPEKLRLYPLIVLSMLKSPLLRKSVDRRSHLSDPRPDDRALYLYQACRISPIMALLLVHPLLFCIPSNDDALPWKTLPSSDGTLMNDLKHAPYVEMPEALSPTISNLDDDKVYLMDTCFAFYVLIEKNVPVDRTKRLDINSGPLGRAITQLRQYSQVKGSQSPSVNWQRPIHTPVIVVNSQESSDKAFYDNLLKWMVVDSTSAEKNLMDFHVDLHRRVQQKM